MDFALSKGNFNTKYAPLAVLGAHLRGKKVLGALESVDIDSKKIDFTATDKLIQILIGILAGCEYLSEVNTRLKSEPLLAQSWSYSRFCEQSNLSRTVDSLSQTKIVEIEGKIREISKKLSRSQRHDWRAYLELDLDLSGLPCSSNYEGSERGYFSGGKTVMEDN